MFIIAGLGNPDEKYQGTRHNVGFDVVDRLAEKYQIAVDTKKHRALIGKGVIEGQKVLLVKPQTYMNLSGEAVHEAVQFYKIPADHVLVIYDDVSLPVGKRRVRPTGSAGGHSHMVGFDLDGQMGTTRCSPHLAGVSGAGRTVTSSSAGVHTHGISVNSTGDGQAHNNLPPYRVVSMWRRVA